MCALPPYIFHFLGSICHLLHASTKPDHRIQDWSNKICPMYHQWVFPYHFNHLRRKYESISLLPIIIQKNKGVSEPGALSHTYVLYHWWLGSVFWPRSDIESTPQWKKHECYTYGIFSWTLNSSLIVPVHCHSEFHSWYQYNLPHYPVGHLNQPWTSLGIHVQINIHQRISGHIYYLAHKCHQKRDCQYITYRSN